MEEGDDVGRTPLPKRRRSLLGRTSVTPGPAPGRDEEAARASDADRAASFIGVGGLVADGLDPAEPASVEGRLRPTAPTIAPVDLAEDIGSLETPIRAQRDEAGQLRWPSAPASEPSWPSAPLSGLPLPSPAPASGPPLPSAAPAPPEAAPTQPVSTPSLVDKPVTQAVQWLVVVGAAALLVALVAVIAIGGAIGAGTPASAPASPISLEPSMSHPSPAVAPTEPVLSLEPVPPEPATEAPEAQPPEAARGKVKLPKLRLGKKKEGG